MYAVLCEAKRTLRGDRQHSIAVECQRFRCVAIHDYRRIAIARDDFVAIGTSGIVGVLAVVIRVKLASFGLGFDEVFVFVILSG